MQFVRFSAKTWSLTLLVVAFGAGCRVCCVAVVITGLAT